MPRSSLPELPTGRFVAVYEREFLTVARTRVYGLVAAGFALAVLALGTVGGVSGYVPVVLGLLTPLELLLPALAAAFGYRALLADGESGEREILRTFPLSRATYVLGVVLARATLLVAIVLAPLVIVGLAVPTLTPESTQFLLRRTTYSGPLLFVRFAVLTAVATVVFFTAVAAISAAAGNARRAVALAVLLVVALAVGLDLAIVAGYATELFPPGALPWLLAASPASAYRGLVLALVVEPASVSSLASGSVLANTVGLFAWFVGSLAVAVRLVRP